MTLTKLADELETSRRRDLTCRLPTFPNAADLSSKKKPHERGCAVRDRVRLSGHRPENPPRPTKWMRFKWLAKGVALLRRASVELATKFPAK